MKDFNFDFESIARNAIEKNTEYISQKLNDAVPKDTEELPFDVLLARLSSASLMIATELSAAMLKHYHDELSVYLETNYQKL